MERSLLLVFITIFLSSTAFSQVETRNSEQNEILSQYLRGVYTDDLSNVDGSPFLNDTFLPGTIYFDDQNLHANVRYDVVKENMQVQLKDEEYILKYGINVDILGKKYRQFNYRRNDKMMVGYFEVLTEGDSPALSLLKKPLKKLKAGQAAGAMRPAKDPRYIDKTDFYLNFETSTYAVPVERRTKKFIKIFPKEHQDQIKEFMNEKGLKPKKEEDVQEVVTYYNSIVSKQ